MMQLFALPSDTKDIAPDLLMENGKLKLLPASEYKKYPWDEFRLFCHNYARYGIPTIGLIEYLKTITYNRDVLEIGAGCGDLGYHLGIKMTDSHQQDNPAVKKMYEDMRQPTIKYGKDVEKIDALEAVKKYKPQVVIGSWITPYAPHQTTFGSNPMGIKEDKILEFVETFIIIGNLEQHWDKPIRKHKHTITYGDWLISRAKDPYKNCIMIWDK